MRVLKVNLLGAPPIRNLVKNDLGDLHFGTANPGHTLLIKLDPSGEDSVHGFSPTLSIRNHFTQRKPTFGVRWFGRTQLRKNTVTRLPASDQAPPRIILYSPVAGPRGFRDSLF